MLETTITGLHYFCSRQYRLKFFLLGAATSRKTFLFLKEGRFGRSRSSKIDKFGANRKRICDFLLVRNSNIGPSILYRFGETARCRCKIRYVVSKCTAASRHPPCDSTALVNRSICYWLFGSTAAASPRPFRLMPGFHHSVAETRTLIGCPPTAERQRNGGNSYGAYTWFHKRRKNYVAYVKKIRCAVAVSTCRCAVTAVP